MDRILCILWCCNRPRAQVFLLPRTRSQLAPHRQWYLHENEFTIDWITFPLCLTPELLSAFLAVAVSRSVVTLSRYIPLRKRMLWGLWVAVLMPHCPMWARSQCKRERTSNNGIRLLHHSILLSQQVLGYPREAFGQVSGYACELLLQELSISSCVLLVFCTVWLLPPVILQVCVYFSLQHPIHRCTDLPV